MLRRMFFSLMVVLVVGGLALSTAYSKSPFVSAKHEQALRQMFPNTEDALLKDILEDPDLILYDETVMPRAYQHDAGVHSPFYNISGDANEARFGTGNTNREFPWDKPFGTDNCNNTGSFNFIKLPKAANGVTWPIVYYTANNPGERLFNPNEIRWLFPAGTVVGEVMTMRGPDGQDYVWEIRIRTRDINTWIGDVYRPFRSREELLAGLEDAKTRGLGGQQLDGLIAYLQPERVNAMRMPLKTMTDTRHPNRVLNMTRATFELPALEDSVVKDLLLNTSFKSQMDLAASFLDPQEAADDPRYPAAPTTKDAFHVVPANYAGHFVNPKNTEECMNCHRTVGRITREFDQPRDWYGNVRGSDGIFSFHPFTAQSISNNGMRRPRTIRSDLIASGVVAQYDSSHHPATVYHRIPGLR